LDAFAFRHKPTARRHSICKVCQRDYVRTYHRKDPAAYDLARNERMAGYRARNRAFVEAYLREHPCVDCGIADTIVLEFDHVRGQKRREISILVGEGARLAALYAEILKCVVRCANCHRRRTAQGWEKRGAERWKEGFQPIVAD
jgi:hypothetical protein